MLDRLSQAWQHWQRNFCGPLLRQFGYPDATEMTKVESSARRCFFRKKWKNEKKLNIFSKFFEKMSRIKKPKISKTY